MASKVIHEVKDAKALIDIGPLLRPRVPMTAELRRALARARRHAERICKLFEEIRSTIEDHQEKDELGSFDLQEMMRQLNQAHTLASTTLPELRDDIAAQALKI